jgi:hypothetical protein
MMKDGDLYRMQQYKWVISSMQIHSFGRVENFIHMVKRSIA